MHLKALRLHKVFVPVRDPRRRAQLARDLRRLLGNRRLVTTSREGVTVRGVLRLEDEVAVHRLAAEVSDWARSSRNSS